MRYINNRYDFLRRFKLNEGTRSGPFENDIPWGDSLLGRMVMAVIRKSSIAINVTRIETLVKKLNEEFNYILDSSTVDSSDVDTKLIEDRCALYALLKELKDSIDNEEEVSVIKSITFNIIELLKNSKIEEDKKNKLLKELDAFYEFLKEFKDEKTSSEDSVGSGGYKFPLMISSLEYLSAILKLHKEGKITLPEPAEQGVAVTDPNSKPNANTNASSTANAEKPTVTADNNSFLFRYNSFSKFLESEKGAADAAYNIEKMKDAKAAKASKTGVENAPSNEVKTEEAQVKPDVAPEATKPAPVAPAAKPAQSKIEQAFPKLKTAIDTLVSKDKISVNYELVQKLLSEKETPEGKKTIETLFKEIQSYLVGDKKATLQERDALYKEANSTPAPVEPVLSRNNAMLVTVAEKIARFTKRALQFAGKDLFVELGLVGSPLESYIKSINGVIAAPTEGKEASSVEPENKESIKEYFEKNVDILPFYISDEELQKLMDEYEKKQNAENKRIVSDINVIDVLKLFNRAYKLHTTNVIPGGRSGGAVSRSVYNEYTAFGGNSGLSGTSDGPYRNNKIFNVWENGVMDILSNKKYQHLFEKNTVIKVGTGDNATERKNGGAIFRKMITDLLNGETLYKKGAQEKFLRDYFGDIDTKGLDNNDKKENTVISDKIAANKVDVSFVNSTMLTENEDIKNSKYDHKFLQLKYKEGEASKIMYLYIESIASGYVTFSFCTSIVYFKKYIDSQGYISIDKFNTLIRGIKNDKGNYRVRYTKMTTDDFKSMLKNSPVVLNSVTVDNVTSKREITPTLVSWLGNESEKTIYTIKEDGLGKVNTVKASNATECITDSNLGGVLNKKYENDFVPISKKS